MFIYAKNKIAKVAHKPMNNNLFTSENASGKQRIITNVPAIYTLYLS